MAVTQGDIDALDAAIATGALRVRYADGREVTYRSLDELRQVRAMLTEQVSGKSSFRRTSVVGF